MSPFDSSDGRVRQDAGIDIFGAFCTASLGIHMDTQPQGNKKPEDNNRCLPPMLVWGSLAAIWGVANLVADNDKAHANQIVTYGLIAWLVSLFIAFIAGKNLKETKDDAVGFTYLVGMVIAGLFVLGIISIILPSSCASNNSQAPADIYYRR